MQYNLWDVETAGYYGHFTDEWEALKLVRALVSHYGVEYAECLSLGRVADDGSVAEPLSGAALVARAEEVADERDRSQAPDLVHPAEVVGSPRGVEGVVDSEKDGVPALPAAKRSRP